MRNFLFSITLLSVPLLMSAQSPVYLMYTTDCVDQLEYRAAYGSSTWLVYSLRPSADAQFLLKAGDSGIRYKNKPQGARTCREFVINDAFADVVNKGERPVYMVHQDADGYMLMPLTACTQVTRYGSVYQFRAPRFAFAVDTNNLVNEQNIAAPNTNAYIYFNGIRFRNCRNEYAFRRMPTGGNQEQSDFDFIPGVGLTSDKTGKSASEAEGNLYRLMKVNGTALEDYIAGMCKSKPQAPPSTVSKWTQEAGYGPSSTTAPDKESASMVPVGPPAPTAAAAPASPLPVECTEKPGYGYHLVMPGESLNAIARSYRVLVKDLVRWNNIKNANHLEICQKVWLMQPPKGANMVSKRKDAPPPPAPVQHNTTLAVEKYDGPGIVRQDAYWGQPTVQQPQQYNTGKSPNYWEQPPTAATNPGYISPVVYNNTGSAPASAAPTVVQPPTAFTHIVKQGETVSGLARYYGITEECLRYQNNMPLTGEAMIYVNQPLRIALCQPGTVPSATQPQPYYTPPQQYSTPAPAQYNYSPPDAAPTTHVVAPRETVSGLSRRYNISEECLRQQNNLPAEGEARIYIGQTLRVSPCGSPERPNQYNAPQPNPNYSVADDPNYKYNPYTGLYEYNPRGNDANYKYNAQTGLYDYIEPRQNTRPGAFLEGPGATPRPNQYNTGKPANPAEPDARPDVFDENQPINGGGGTPNFTTKGGTTSSTQYFGEHVVKQGENLRTIAIIYNMSTAELAQLNSISETESLMPGKRLVVPRK
jgi:LysM repeat protein